MNSTPRNEANRKDEHTHVYEIAMNYHSKEFADLLYRERVLRARKMKPEDKLLAGGRLFELSCRIMRDGIRDQFPDADEAKVEQELKRRLKLMRILEESE